MLHFLLGATVLAACAAWTDLRRGVIPNPLTLFAFSGALGAHFVRGTMAGGVAVGLQEVGLSLAGATVCAVVPLFMFLRGAMGAGDVKLFAALGAWFGWTALPAVILLASVVGAAVGLTLMFVARRGREVPIPFGPYLAGAGLLALYFRDPLASFYGLG